MGVLIDFLSTDRVRQSPAMFFGSGEFRDIAFWVCGFDDAMSMIRPDEPSEIVGFGEWLVMRLDGPSSTNWAGVLRWKFGDGEFATGKFFECLSGFLDEVAERGVAAIFDDHRRYETARYGQPGLTRRP